MPDTVRHIPVKSGKNWAIVEKSTGRIKGRSTTRAKAKSSVRARSAGRHGTGRRARR